MQGPRARNHESKSTVQQLDELYQLIDGMQVAMLTTRRPDGQLVSRPMQTQQRRPDIDLWFVTSDDTHKLDELEHDPHVNVAYFNDKTREWVSVSGIAHLSRDRAKIHELYDRGWRAWLTDQGGERDGGPDDPRIILIMVDAQSVVYMKTDRSRPAVLYEVAKGVMSGRAPKVGDMHHLDKDELQHGQHRHH